MNKKERLLAAVSGHEVDHVPVTAWVHFLSDHLEGTKVAELHERFLQAYDWDVLKVMNDYRYPVPAGITTLDSAESLRAYRLLDMSEANFSRQFECLRTLRANLGADLPILDTVFEPYQQIVRNVGFGQSANFFRSGKAAIEAIEVVTETTCNYVRTVKRLGVDGVFLSINGAIPADRPRGSTVEQHETFQKKFAIEVLNAAEGMIRVVHVHGDHLDIDRIWDYPCEVISISDRLAGNPSLAELRKRTDKCLMGGLDETKFAERTLPEMAAEVDDALRQTAGRRFILAPGCTIPSFSPERNLNYLRAYSRAKSI